MDWGLKALDWLIMLLCAMAGFIFRTHNQRIDKLEKCLEELEKRLPSTFEREELTRQRVRHEQFFDKIFVILDDIRNEGQERHVELLEKLASKADK